MPAKPTLLRDKRKEATAQEILAAAEAELAEHGLAATAMSAIARRAGVAVGTLYNYYKDKDVLLATLLAERRRQFASFLDETVAAQRTAPFEAQLERVINAVFQIFETHRDFLRIMLANEPPTLPSGRRSAEKTPAMLFIDRLRPLVATGVQMGALSPVDADLYASALAALMRGVMIERIADRSRPFSEATPFVLRIFLDGARRRPER